MKEIFRFIKTKTLKFILTIDTEGDNQWDHGRELTVKNIRYVPRFQDLCNKYLIRPTYLVTSEVCNDALAREIFTEFILHSQAEVGAHLHVWTTPPFLDKDGYRYNDVSHAYATELPEDLINKKIENLTNQIESSIGQRPFSFRSGRFGFDEKIARILVKNSYLVDSSVTPCINWRGKEGIRGGIGGPDFLDRTTSPYLYDFDNGSLAEIPVTVLATKFPLNKNKQIARYYLRNVDKNIFLRIARRLLFKNQPLWLRPLPWMNINMFNALLSEAKRIKVPYIVMMFHSSELMPDCSKYRTDDNSIEKLYDLLTGFFDLLKKENIPSVTLTEAAKSFIQ